MNVNLWNVKDLFSTPTKLGPNKSSSWNSDHNSMSDSQFLLGSQFCPDNSQSASTPLELRQSSQQNSQENEPSIFSKYESKPQLFGAEEKEKGSLNFPAGRLKSVIEQFEESKKRIKEKNDNEILSTFFLNTKESLQRLQTFFETFEETLKSGMDNLGNVCKTTQETSQSLYGLVLNALKDKSEMEQALVGMKKSLEDKDAEISEVKSSVQMLKKSVEELTTQQNEQHKNICEKLDCLQFPRLLAELQAFLSAPRESKTTILRDSVSQTSPAMLLPQLPYTSHWSILNAPPGNQLVSNIIASQGKENVNIEQSPHLLTLAPNNNNNNNNNTLCTCASANIPAGIAKECWLFTQETQQATPVRKVVRRDNRPKGIGTLKHSELNKAGIDIHFMQNHAVCHKNEKLAAEGKVQSKGGARRINKPKPKNRSQRKRLPSVKKEAGCSRSSKTSTKPKDLGNVCSGSRTSQPSSKKSKSTGGFSHGCSNTAQIKRHQPCDKKVEKLKFICHSHEDEPFAPNLMVQSAIKKDVDPFSTKINSCFWACSSPEGPLSQSQMKWFNLFGNYSSAFSTPSQQKKVPPCPFVPDSDYSD